MSDFPAAKAQWPSSNTFTVPRDGSARLISASEIFALERPFPFPTIVLHGSGMYLALQLPIKSHRAAFGKQTPEKQWRCIFSHGL